MASRSRSHRRFPRPAVRPIGNTHSRSRFRPSLLVLEERTMLSTFQVTNANDSGSGSLPYELSQAGNGDTITFSSLFNTPQTITLSSGELDVTKDVTIQGPGKDLLTISGGTLFVTSPASPAQGSTISGLTITNGGGFYGGGVSNSGTLSLIDCNVSHCGSPPGLNPGVGGGIYNTGTLTLTGCSVFNNNAQAGGGIYNTKTLTLIGSGVSGNGSLAGGGGIWNANGGTVTLTDSFVNNNVTNGAGGGIYESPGSPILTMTDCIVQNNKSGLGGGGIFESKKGSGQFETGPSLT